MKWHEEQIEHHECPPAIAKALTVAGGSTPSGFPNFRLIWGFARFVKIFGRWEEWEPARPTGLYGADGRPQQAGEGAD